jgi:hypothetical protein
MVDVGAMTSVDRCLRGGTVPVASDVVAPGFTSITAPVVASAGGIAIAAFCRDGTSCPGTETGRDGTAVSGGVGTIWKGICGLFEVRSGIGARAAGPGWSGKGLAAGSTVGLRGSVGTAVSVGVEAATARVTERSRSGAVSLDKAASSDAFAGMVRS